MMIIDSDNYVGAGIETMFFPGGEPHAKVPYFRDASILLHLKLRTWSDVAFAACIQDALTTQESVRFKAFIPYFPAARQDRTDGTAPLTSRMMADFLGYSSDTFVFDPHSDALHRFLEFRAFMPSDLGLTRLVPVTGVIAPDAGATARAADFLKAFHPSASLIQCTKTRDSRTGRLSNYELPKLPEAGRYIIVDDICDGGGTFNLLADAFFHDSIGRDSQLEMFVSHGIFSKGLSAIDSRIERITTTDSWCRLPSDQRLFVIPLLPNLIKYFGG